MQIVRPIDAEDALRAYLSERLGVDAFAPPAPDDIAPPCICVERVGGGRESAVSHEHDVLVHCWASDEAGAVDLADRACGELSRMPVMGGATTARCNLPALVPDPFRPTIPRARFAATIGMRGEGLF